MNSYTAAPIPVPGSWRPGRAEIVFAGVDQAGPSFEGRVFLNNSDADVTTPRLPRAGYAGSFHVYGYGEPAPPAIADAKRRQADGGEAVAPIEKRLHADEAAVRAALEASNELTVTVVPVPVEPGAAAPKRPFARVEVVFDRATTDR